MKSTTRTDYRARMDRALEEHDDRPCIEIYLNDPTEVPEAELLTKICLPIRG
jgi:AraC family transcriptional regulator